MKRILETLVVDRTAMLAVVSRRVSSIHINFWLESATLTYATDQLRLDMAEYFRKRIVENETTRQSAMAVCDNALRLIDHYVSTEALWQESLFEAPRFRISVEQMAPVVLARKICAGFLCLDEKIRFIAQELGIQVYW